MSRTIVRPRWKQRSSNGWSCSRRWGAYAVPRCRLSVPTASGYGGWRSRYTGLPQGRWC